MLEGKRFMKKKVILHLCADTGTDTKPYADDPAYEVILIGSEIGIENYHVDQEEANP